LVGRGAERFGGGAQRGGGGKDGAALADLFSCDGRMSAHPLGHRLDKQLGTCREWWWVCLFVVGEREEGEASFRGEASLPPAS
jgi:hypothetical protein